MRLNSLKHLSLFSRGLGKKGLIDLIGQKI